jgi:stearoyl-CoA desaturase (delta-9 desaturase)
MGWLLVGDSKHSETALMSKYAPDLGKDRFYLWLNKYHWVPMIVLGVVLFAIGGISFVLWGI